jgi:NAD(P)-dependent dehydrogenase (short-subunit alcohol dehydrogenase family)
VLSPLWRSGIARRAAKDLAAPDFSAEVYREHFAINTDGVAWCMRYELQQMLKQWEAAGGDKLRQQITEQAHSNPNDLGRYWQMSIINNSSICGLNSCGLAAYTGEFA